MWGRGERVIALGVGQHREERSDPESSMSVQSCVSVCVCVCVCVCVMETHQAASSHNTHTVSYLV